jgi:hypothetical protein
MRRMVNRRPGMSSRFGETLSVALPLVIGWAFFELMSGGLLPSATYWMLSQFHGLSVRPDELIHPQDLVLVTAALAFARIPDLVVRRRDKPSASHTALVFALLFVALVCSMLGTNVRFAGETHSGVVSAGRIWAIALPLFAVGLILCVLAFLVSAREDVLAQPVPYGRAQPRGARRPFDAGEPYLGSAELGAAASATDHPSDGGVAPSSLGGWRVFAAAALSAWVLVRRIRRC